MNNTVKNILKTVKDNEITTIRFEYLSSDGKLRGMVTHADFLEEAITNGIGLAKGAWSLGGFDQLIDVCTSYVIAYISQKCLSFVKKRFELFGNGRSFGYSS